MRNLQFSFKSWQSRILKSALSARLKSAEQNIGIGA